MTAIARAAMISVDLATGEYSIDLFSNVDDEHGPYENPSLQAHAFADAVRDDMPEREFVVVGNKAAGELLAQARLKSLGL